MRIKPMRKTDVFCMLFVGAATFCISCLFALRGVDPQHQGFLLKPAIDVARGLKLYGETFTQYGALPIYVFAAVVSVFGETVAAINIATCAVYALCGMLLFTIVRRYANAVVAALCTLIAIGMAAFYFWNFHPWPSVFALLLSLVATVCMIRFIESGRMRWLLLCGMATAAMFWCRQPQGLTAVCGAMLLAGFYFAGYYDKRGLWRALLWFAFGNLIVHAAFFAVVLLQGTLHDWWIQVILNAFTFATDPTPETAATRPDSLFQVIFVGLNGNPRYDFVWRVLTYGTLVYFVVLCVRVLSIAHKSRRKAAPDPALLGCIAFAGFALFNWPHYFPTLCYRHVFWCDYPMFGVLGVALYQLLAHFLPAKPGLQTDGAQNSACKRARLVTALTCALMLLLCANNLLLRARIGKARLLGGGNGARFTTVEQAEEDTVLRYEHARYGYLNGLYLSARETRFYNGLFDTLANLQRQYPDKNIVNLTSNALFSVFTSDNPHLRPYDNDPRDFGYPDQMTVTMAYIEMNKPIVLSHEPLAGYVTAAYLTDYNGDYWRFEPFYVLTPAA